MQTLHWVMVGLGAVVTGCQMVAEVMPQYASYAHALSGVAVALGTLLGLMTPKALGVSPQPPVNG